MAKLAPIFLLFILLFCGNEMVPITITEAKECHKVWDCQGDNRCWEDCKRRYNGRGMCDLYTPPLVPKQCFCAYKC